MIPDKRQKDLESALGVKQINHEKNRTFVLADCRHALENLQSDLTNSIITSPPYGNLKNYGTVGETGHGQSIKDEYLPELKNTLTELNRISLTGGALWLVLDMFRYRGKTIALPFEVMERAREAGWVFQDMIVWDKGRNLPWSHHGRFRSVSEHILLFSKGKKLNHFNIDDLRTTEGLSRYWVKYPERYHPDGKAPTDIWHIPIPMQGGWSTGSKAQHFCPFPIELINRMVSLTTVEGDVVLDPFCGTGSVLVSASSLGRFAIGFDINKTFYKNYKSYGSSALEEEAQQLKAENQHDLNIHHAILNLRANKFATVIFREISKLEVNKDEMAENILAIMVDNFKIYNKKKQQPLASIEISVLMDCPITEHIQEMIRACVQRSPLSNFGLDADVKLFTIEKALQQIEATITNPKSKKTFYIYKRLRFNQFSDKVHLRDILNNPSNYLRKKEEAFPPIFSPLKLNISPVK